MNIKIGYKASAEQFDRERFLTQFSEDVLPGLRKLG
jgi:hypothetical protein